MLLSSRYYISDSRSEISATGMVYYCEVISLVFLSFCFPAAYAGPPSCTALGNGIYLCAKTTSGESNLAVQSKTDCSGVHNKLFRGRCFEQLPTNESILKP